MENGKTLEYILAVAQLTQTDTILWVVNFGFIITECRSLYWITPNNRHFHTTFEGKKRIKVSLIITVHSVVTTCVSIPCIAHPMSYPPEHGDQVRALAVVKYRSVTNWVIIRAHKHPFIVVIGLILHPVSPPPYSGEGAVIVNIIVLVALAALWPDLSLMCLYLLCWTHYHISTTHRRSSILNGGLWGKSK